MAVSDTATNSTYSLLPRRLVALEQTPSPFPGSIAVLKDSKEECCGYAVLSGSTVIIVKWGLYQEIQHVTVQPFARSEDVANSVDGLTLVTGVRWCYLASGETVLIYNADGSLRIFQYRTTHNDQTTVASCVKGIASIGNSICVGSYEGHILVFSIKDEEGVEYIQQLEGHTAPITCLDSSRDGKVASGDEKGTVLVWKDPVRTKEFTVLYNDSSSNQFSCVNLRWFKDMVIGGYANGTLRVFSVKLGKAMIEVSAHSQLISSLDVATVSGLILTVSEDSTVCVWQLSNTNKVSPQISLVHNRLIENSLLSGGVICDDVGSMFAIAKYDHKLIMEFGKS